MRNNSHLSYRPDIDGLRSVAILLAVIFHAFPTAIRVGKAWKSFFVISRYLISSIIFKKLDGKSSVFLIFTLTELREFSLL